MHKRKNFRWRYQPRNNKDIKMFDYISNSNMRSNTEMILLALRAFWLPLAIANSSEFDETTKREIANEAITIFISQLKQFSAVFGESIYNQLISDLNHITTTNTNAKVNKTYNNLSINVSAESNIDEEKQTLGMFEYNTDSFNNW